MLEELIHSPDLVRRDAFVSGRWIETLDKSPVVDPATGKEWARISSLPVEAVEEAVDSAIEAMPSWQAKLPLERGKILRRWAELIRENKKDLATLITCEQGKPLFEAQGEVDYAAGFLDWFAAEGERTYGETLPSHKPNSMLTVRYQPIGVTACVTPWNFPLAMITRKAGAALAAGCPMIAKPAPETPLTALALARLAEKAHIPTGIFQVLTGDAVELTEALLNHCEIRAFSFTGSTEVGRQLLKLSSSSVKKVSMELGGHAPFIVTNKADLDLAVDGCMAAKFATSGQDCLAANRIYVHSDLKVEFAYKLGEKVRALKVGAGLEEGVDIGPMTHVGVANKCRGQIRDALEKGARALVGGNDLQANSTFVEPTLLVDVTEDMLIAHEETFGPVAAILEYSDTSDLIRRANDSEMGLAAYVYTDDLNEATLLSNALEYGMVGVNTPSFTGPPIPFGGWKQSGLGREGSRHGILEYMETKYVCTGGLNRQ